MWYKVRKRPLNKKEISRKEDDIVTVSDNALSVHEPKLKVCPLFTEVNATSLCVLEMNILELLVLCLFDM